MRVVATLPGRASPSAAQLLAFASRLASWRRRRFCPSFSKVRADVSEIGCPINSNRQPFGGGHRIPRDLSCANVQPVPQG